MITCIGCGESVVLEGTECPLCGKNNAVEKTTEKKVVDKKVVHHHHVVDHKKGKK